MTTTYIGVDLAWSERNGSGLAVARGSAASAELAELSWAIQPFGETADWIVSRAGNEHCIVAIDAPLVVPNETGMRDCERELSSVFRSAWAGTHSSNRTTFAAGGPPELASALARHGFRHAADIDALRAPGRWMIEVYPHPALVRLFSLSVRLAYKKGGSDAKRAGLRQLALHVRSLSAAEPALLPGNVGSELLDSGWSGSTKSLEDRLDAWLCAYIALYACRWGSERTRVFGSVDAGYIVVPDAARNLESARAAFGSSMGTFGERTAIAIAESRPRARRLPGGRGSAGTTSPGFVNRNRQQVIRNTGQPGTDHGQKIYLVECCDCRHACGVNGSGFFQSCCPRCQGGAGGFQVE